MDGGTGFATMAPSPSGDWRLCCRQFGRVPKWPKGADCKSAGVRLQRFESSHAHFSVRLVLADLLRRPCSVVRLGNPSCPCFQPILDLFLQRFCVVARRSRTSVEMTVASVPRYAIWVMRSGSCDQRVIQDFPQGGPVGGLHVGFLNNHSSLGVGGEGDEPVRMPRPFEF